MATFAVVIQGAPYSSQAAHSALLFCEAVLASGHRLQRLFFWQDGVHNASALCTPPQDERNLPRAWQQLIAAHGIDAVVCVASALRRGIVDAGEARRYELNASNLLPGFVLGGLGQLVDAHLQTDRLVTFAP